MKEHHSNSILQRFFAGIAENIFQTRLGVADPPLIDYISGMMIRFVHLDGLHKVRNPRGQRLSYLADMLKEAEARIGDARRDVHRHVGDFALFWAGLYPEALRRPAKGSSYDFYYDYCQQGKHAYFVASTIESSREEDTSGDLLQRLSDQFELCAYGLREVRNEWENRDSEGDAPLWIG